MIANHFENCPLISSFDMSIVHLMLTPNKSKQKRDAKENWDRFLIVRSFAQIYEF